MGNSPTHQKQLKCEINGFPNMHHSSLPSSRRRFFYCLWNLEEFFVQPGLRQSSLNGRGKQTSTGTPSRSISPEQEVCILRVGLQMACSVRGRDGAPLTRPTPRGTRDRGSSGDAGSSWRRSLRSPSHFIDKRQSQLLLVQLMHPRPKSWSIVHYGKHRYPHQRRVGWEVGLRSLYLDEACFEEWAAHTPHTHPPKGDVKCQMAVVAGTGTGMGV